jgi:peptidoglycan hydrolase-like protein with peptidoglycan-binding domain
MMSQHPRRHHHDPNNRDATMRAVYTRRRLLVASGALALPLAVWRTSGTSQSSGHTTTPATPALTVGNERLDAPASTPPTTVDTDNVDEPPTDPAQSAEVPSLDHNLYPGMVDPKIEILQDRLRELSFDPGPTDGYFGDQTVRSVWAFEKLVLGLPREDSSAVVTPAAWERLHADVTIVPRRQRSGTHVEVYLPEQAAAVFTDGVAVLVTHVSSGTGDEWCDEVTIDNDDGTQTTKGICGISFTPGGVYHFERKIDGWRNAALGRLYKPVYFNYGIAIHGATNVPNRPASRGCVRTPMHIAEYFPDLVSIGDAVFVFDGEVEPEQHGAQLPVFDWRDPDWVDPDATTTTTTTTEPPAPTTTESLPTTTTSAPAPVSDLPSDGTSTTTPT